MKRKELKKIINRIICIGLISLAIGGFTLNSKVNAQSNGVPSITLDRSHMDTVNDMGAEYGVNSERTIANEITNIVGSKLSSYGINVKYTRSMNEPISIAKRVSDARKDVDRNYYLSIHLNSTKEHLGANGSESFNIGDGSIADRILKDLNSELGIVNRGIKESVYYNCNIDGESDILELGFIDNKTEIDNIKNNKEKIADIIVNSILKEFDINIKDQAIKTNDIYRVIDNNGKQVGAYKNLQGAKSVCEDGFYIKDNAQNIIYKK